MLGNAGLNESQLKSKVIVLLFNYPKGLPPGNIFHELFPDSLACENLRYSLSLCLHLFQTQKTKNFEKSFC